MLLGKFVPIFNTFVDIKNRIEKFSAGKPESFQYDGIFKLRERWRNVVEQNGTYKIQ